MDRALQLPIGSTASLRIGLPGFALLLSLAVGSGASRAEDKPKTLLKSESFDKDPGWEGFNNRIVPKKTLTVTQAFGYSDSAIASKEKGEVGGKVTRSAKPAYCADKIAPRTLQDKLTASGTFALTASTGSSGVFFGWFNAEQQDGAGKPMNSLGLQFDGEKTGARLVVQLIGETNRVYGTFVTPFIPGKFRPTPIKNDGTRYTWTLAYDPEANEGNGQFQVTVQSNSAKPEEFEGKKFSVNLPANFKKDGAAFNRFGLMSMMKPGGAMTIHFGDLMYDGKKVDLARDPGWVGSNNRAQYEDVQVGAHNFGFSPATSFAGGVPGEVGGGLWRSGKYGYYADKVGMLTLEHRLQASGKVVLKVGAPDSDVYIGWFSSAGKDRPPAESADFLGVHVGGPTRVGHYFHPALATTKGTRGLAKTGPVLVPGKVCDWSLVYDPTAEEGRGAIRVTLGKESVTLVLKKGQKAEGGRFDRFGLFNSTAGGQLVRIYLDDLKYTAAGPHP
jgi:hypothetical protein